MAEANGNFKAIIGSYLANNHLEHVRDCEKTDKMRKVNSDLYGRRTFLNHLAVFHKFYTAKIETSE